VWLSKIPYFNASDPEERTAFVTVLSAGNMEMEGLFRSMCVSV
jgi:hypothetical protein